MPIALAFAIVNERTRSCLENRQKMSEKLGMCELKCDARRAKRSAGTTFSNVRDKAFRVSKVPE